MRKFLFYFLFCFYFLPAQNKDWRSVTPFKDYSDIKKIEIADNNIVYVLDNLNDRFCISVNNGKSWKVSEIADIEDFSLASDIGGFILFSSKIYKSSNRLFTNSKIIQLPITTAKSIYFYNDNIGFITTSNGKILKTINKGDSWTVYNTPSSTEIRSIYFINSSTGFAITASKQIIGTKDGGITWAIVKTITNNPYKILFKNNTNGIAVGKDGIINYTNDGGETWFIKEVSFSLNDIKIVNGRFFGVGNGSQVFNSENGIDWTMNKIESTNTVGYTLTAFGFKNSNFYIGTDGTQFMTKLFYSQNLTNWSSLAGSVRRMSLQYTYYFNSNDVLSLGSSTSYISQNAALISSDGGKNWKNVSTGLVSSATINAFAALPSGKSIIASNKNAFYKTIDNGKTWSLFSVPNIPTGNSIRKIVMFENGDIYFFFWTSTQGPLNLIKYNQTTSWSSPSVVNNLNSTIKSMEFVNSMVGYALTYGNYFYKTTDGGKAWGLIHNFPSYMTQEKINIIDENLFYVGNYYTTDGGATWKDFEKDFDIYNINKDGSGYGVYHDWSLYKTTNYGNNWNAIFDPSSFFYGTGVLGVYSNGNNVIMIGGSNSDIFIIDDTDTVLSNNDINIKENQRVLVYPNPSSEVLNFSSANKIIFVRIFNMEGQNMYEIKNIKNNSINISNLKTGVYIANITNELGVSTKIKFIKK